MDNITVNIVVGFAPLKPAELVDRRDAAEGGPDSVRVESCVAGRVAYFPSGFFDVMRICLSLATSASSSFSPGGNLFDCRMNATISR